MITYENSGSPPIAEAEPCWEYTDAQRWVRENGEPMMMPDGDHYMILVIAMDGKVEAKPYWGITDKHQSAAAMRQDLTPAAKAD